TAPEAERASARRRSSPKSYAALSPRAASRDRDDFLVPDTERAVEARERPQFAAIRGRCLAPEPARASRARKVSRFACASRELRRRAARRRAAAPDAARRSRRGSRRATRAG